MGPFEPGEYVKAEFSNEKIGEREWMWVEIDTIDNAKRIVFGRLDTDLSTRRPLMRSAHGSRKSDTIAALPTRMHSGVKIWSPRGEE